MIVNNGAMVRDKDGATRLRHLLAKDTACRVVQATSAWRECTSVVFDRAKANQVIVEKINFEDGIRGMYYRRNREFLGETAPLENCLTENPIQVMLAGPVAAMREAERVLRSARIQHGVHTGGDVV